MPFYRRRLKTVKKIYPGHLLISKYDQSRNNIKTNINEKSSNNRTWCCKPNWKQC